VSTVTCLLKVSFSSELQLCAEQERNEVRWRPGQEASLAPHIRTWGLSEANALYWRRYFWNCGTFRRRLKWFGARGIVSPLRPRSAPGAEAIVIATACWGKKWWRNL